MPIKKITFIYTIFLKEDYTEPIGLKGNTRYVIVSGTYGYYNKIEVFSTMRFFCRN